LSLPNYITFIRLLCIPFFFTTLLSYQGGEEHVRLWALGIFFFATFTDALDGILARVLKQKTSLGEFLDPLADKLLLLSGFLGILYVPDLIYRPALWITVTIVFRDIVLTGGYIVLNLLTGHVKLDPSFLGKCTTAFQMGLLLSVLLQWPIAITLGYITAALTILSGVHYVRIGIKMLHTS